MSGRSLVGLAALDGLLLGTGYAALFAFLGRFDRRLLLRYGGLAFWLGTALVGLALTLVAVLSSLGPRWWLVLVVVVAIAVAGITAGVRRRHRTSVTAPEAGRFGLAAVPFAAATGLVLAGVFAAAYNRPLYDWDALAFWIPKAKSLYFSGTFDASTIAGFSGTTYPMLVPVLHAAAFGFMGSADEVAIHIQPWVFVATFVWACVGLLRPRCPHALIWPFLALLVVLPNLDESIVLKPDGDYPSFLLFVLGAVALLRWVEDEAPWALAAGAAFLAAAASAKREGTVYLLAAFLASYVVTVGSARQRWPLLTLAGAAALATTVPWRLWIRAHEVVADSVPPSGLVADGVDTGDAWKGIEVVFHYLFSYGDWSVAPWVGLIMLASAAIVVPRRIAAFAGVTLLIVVAAMVWRVLWYGAQDSADAGSASPIPRLAVLFSMLLLVISPLIASALLAIEPRGVCNRLIDHVDRVGERLGRFGVVGLAVAPAALFVLVGLTRGDYSFVAGRCSPPVREGRSVTVVFGYPGSYAEALALANEAGKVGFVGLKTGFDECGRLRVGFSGLSPKVGREIRAEAEPVGFFPVLVGEGRLLAAGATLRQRSR